MEGPQGHLVWPMYRKKQKMPVAETEQFKGLIDRESEAKVTHYQQVAF